MKDESARHIACPLILLFALSLAFWAQAGNGLCDPRSRDASQSRPGRSPQVAADNSRMVASPGARDAGLRQRFNLAMAGESLTGAACSPGLDVQVLTPGIEAEILARAGEYPVEKPLQIGVMAGAGGWSVSLMASDLKPGKADSGGIVRKQEVCLALPDGESVPLDQPVRVVAGGQAGKSFVEIRLALATAEIHEPGVYEGCLFLVFQEPQGPQSPAIKVPIRVTVKASAQMSIRDNQIYFHFGRPNQELSAAVTGHITADLPLRLTLRRLENGRVDALPLVLPVSSGTSGPGRAKAAGTMNAAAGIPMEWRLHEGNGSGGREPDSLAEDGQGVSWDLKSSPGEVDYRIDCTVKPENCQAPGNYGMSLIVVLEPML